MDTPPPAARTAVAVAVYCHAGRTISHPVRPGWERPCQEPGTEDIRVFGEDGRPSWRRLCRHHMGELVADGLAA